MNASGKDVKAIFTEALRLPERSQRAAYLDRACGGDAGLRRRVEALLAAHARADEALCPAGATSTEGEATPGAAPDIPAAIEATDTDRTIDRAPIEPHPTAASGSDGDGPAPGALIRYFGDYEIRNELGRGGMGVVYEARQVSLNRMVALKMVKAGLLAGAAELRRFQNEAEAVALLDHAGIVPVYEVGDHDGQHYFSMKLVPGGSVVPLLPRYKDDPRAAARLVAEAAEAVAHAHARGILHRDLKPANILVDDEGHPHVTDFGLAKKVEDDVEFTQSGAILGTPAYMSPEQASGRRGAVTTASDVYGLGAVLYALLTGRAPFGGDCVVETIDAVRSRPPEPPRKLNASVPGDLETICLKCLEKDPRRRYPTALALADDLRAWLGSRPIAARRVGPAERAWLWCRRRPAVAGLSAAVLLAVVCGAAATIAVQYRANRRLDRKNVELRDANAQVQARFELARDAIRSFKEGVEQEEALKEHRLRPLRDKLLGSARRFYDRLGALLEDQTDDASRAVLAESYRELGELIDKIGQKPEALEAYKKAVALRRELAAAPGAGAAARVDLALALNAMGDEARKLDDHDGAVAAHEEARVLAEPLEAGAGATIEARRALGTARHLAGLALELTGADGRAMAAFRGARAVREPLVRDAAAIPEDRLELAHSIACIGGLLEKSGDLAGALAEQRKALELRRVLAADHPDVPLYRHDLGASHILVGGLLDKSGDQTQALAEHRKAQEIVRALVAEYPAVSDYRRDLAVDHNWVGGLLEMTGDLAGALAEQRQSQELMRALAAEHPAVPQYRSDLAVSHGFVGGLLEKTGDLAGALAEQRKFQELMRALAAGHPDVPDYRRELAVGYNTVGGLLEKTGDLAGALAEQRKFQELMRALAAEHPADCKFRRDLAVSHNWVGGVLQKIGDPAGALREYRTGQELVRALAAEHPAVPEYRSDLAVSHNRVGSSLAATGDLAGALVEQKKNLEMFRAMAAEHPDVPDYRRELAVGHIRVGNLLTRAGRPAEALYELERCRSLLEALVQADPNVPDYRDLLGLALNSAADALRDLGRIDEARDRVARAVAVAEALASAWPKAPAYSDGLADALRRRAWLRFEAGDAAGSASDARRAVDLLEGLPSRSGWQWFWLACARATLAAAAVYDGPGPSVVAATGLADRATDDLRRAAAMGYRNPAQYRYEPALDRLRSRDDFRELMRDLDFPADPFAR